MSWFDPVRRIYNRLTKDPLPQEVRIFYTGQTQAGEFISGDTALQNAVVWACVTYLGRTVGQLPWRVMIEDGNGVTRRIPTHPVDYLLSRRPCPEFPPLAWRETMVGWAAMHGNAVAEIVRDNRGLAIGLYPVHPERVNFKRDLDTNELIYEISSQTNAMRTLRADQVFHVRGYGDGPVGLDVVSYAAQSIGWAQATQMFGASFFGEGINPSVAVEVPGKLTKDGYKTLRASLDSVYKGPRRANKAFIADGGMKLTKISSTPEEAQFIETRQHQIAEQCRWFGVPPHKVMDLLRGTFSNIEHQSIEVVVDCITPWALRFEQEADYKLFGPVNKAGYFTRIDLKGLLRGDFKSRQEGLAIMRQWGVVSADEWRALEDMNPLEGEGGDKYIVPLNFTTLEQVGVVPEPPPAAPAPVTNVNNHTTFPAVNVQPPEIHAHITTPPVQNTVTVQPPDVNVRGGDVLMPDVKVDNHITTPEVQNHVTVQPPDVNVRAGDVTMPDVKVDAHFTQPEIISNVTVEPAQVNVQAGDVNMPKGFVQVEARIDAPVNNIKVEQPAAPNITVVNVKPDSQRIERDKKTGEITRIIAEG